MATAIKKRIKLSKQKLCAYVSIWGYQILDIETQEILYEGGNNPFDSSPTQNLTPSTGALDIGSLSTFAKATGTEMAKENKAMWCGVKVRCLI